MAILPYGIAIQRAAERENLDADLLIKLTQDDNQDNNTPVTIDQCYIIDVIAAAQNENLPIWTAITYVAQCYKHMNQPVKSPLENDVLGRTQAYYAAQHFSELKNPLTKRVMRIFKRCKKREYEQASHMKFRQLPKPMYLIILRAVRRDMLNLKHITLETAMDKDIREIITHKNSTIWKDLGLPEPEI